MPAPTLQSNLQILATSYDSPQSTSLSDLLIAELLASGVTYDDLGPPLTAKDIPIFLIVLQDGEPVACGGLRPLPASASGQLLVEGDGAACTTAEVKRMYVVPSLRGKQHGISDIVMRALEDEARRRGFAVLKLATGRAMGLARRFYERQGFVECGGYGVYEGDTGSVYYEKRVGGT